MRCRVAKDAEKKQNKSDPSHQFDMRLCGEWYLFNMKQTMRLHDFFHPVVERAIAPCEATPIASQSLLIAGWKKSMRVKEKKCLI
jgi:hypothetical protein